MITRSRAGIFKPKLFTLVLSASTLPRSVLEALLIPSWKEAMLLEFLTLLKKHTWTLTTLPPGKNLIGCTWVFKLKKYIDGTIARYKERLVAQGFSQVPGFDFNETFSPVVKPATIRLTLSIYVSCCWVVTHLDINVFLNGNLEEDIYMRQPIDFEQGGPHLVCKLNKVIYGLKQASRAWFATVYSVLLSLDFSQSRSDASLFFRIKGTELGVVSQSALRLRGRVSEPCQKDPVNSCAKEPIGDHGVQGDALLDASAEQGFSTGKGNEKSRENADVESDVASVQDHKRSWRDVVTQGGKKRTCYLIYC
ncbi:hypothetical protein SASPL_109376 [Salvia splendens]|uniref:Reverse transcriptase Ty1/copia-type domain-containing protein n=1 Tax=Salvia splendens TaxID=180675 RepID=A0A8X9A699_SALSN|nr:hypothetical protein SASPL_109376 [Salvia splendens]